MADTIPTPATSGLDPAVFTRFMLRLGAARHTAATRGEQIVRVRLSPRAHRYLQDLAAQLYDSDLDAALDVATLPDAALELSDVRFETF